MNSPELAKRGTAAGVTQDLGLVSFKVPVQKPVTTSKEYRTFSNTDSHGTLIRIRIIPKYYIRL